MNFKVVDPQKGKELRRKFEELYFDKEAWHKWYDELSQKIKSILEPKEEFTWDFLKDNSEYQKECTMEEALGYLGKKDRVFVMWNKNHTGFTNGSVIRVYKECLPDGVIEANAAELCDCIKREWDNDGGEAVLPEDIYCFDEGLEWYVIFTHEGWTYGDKPWIKEEDYIRICFIKRND